MQGTVALVGCSALTDCALRLTLGTTPLARGEEHGAGEAQRPALRPSPAPGLRARLCRASPEGSAHPRRAAGSSGTSRPAPRTLSPEEAPSSHSWAPTAGALLVSRAIRTCQDGGLCGHGHHQGVRAF